MRLRFALCAAMAWVVASTGCGKVLPCRAPCPPTGAVCQPEGGPCPPPGGTVCEAPGGTTREVPGGTTRERATPRPAAGPPEAPARTREVVEREVSVTQDTLLVPRMVYMPYMPYAPTAPVRMRTAELQERLYVDERGSPRDAGGPRPREAASPRPASADDRLLETLDKCSQMIVKMDQRLSDLETRTIIESRPKVETRVVPGGPAPAPEVYAQPGPAVVCPPLPYCPPAPYCPPTPPARRIFNRLCPPAPDCLPLPYCPPVPPCVPGT